jgi:hypothetical protein
MHKLGIVFAIAIQLFTAFSSFADRDMPTVRPLSEHSRITLLTCDPGDPLYSTFGHSAIGVFDPAQRINWVFNYGTFDFNVQHFYAKFASGKLLYKLSFGSKERFLREYQHAGRIVVEDELNLTAYQKQTLFNHLLENYKPENRLYKYDFFFDNCATRILDIIYEALGDSLVYQPTGNEQEQTFRSLIDEYLGNKYWSDFGIDIALGSIIDKPATERQKAFLPDYLKEYLYRCTINGKSFINQSRTLVKESRPLPFTPFLLRPALIFWFIFAFIVFLTIKYRHKSWVIGDRILFVTWGLVGVIVLLLWVATDHDATAGNLNVLWANPLYLVYAFAIGNKKTLYLKWSSAIVLALNLIVILGWGFIPQQFHIVFVPIIGSLIVRSGVQFMRNL